jgi:hypothetical protein
MLGLTTAKITSSANNTNDSISAKPRIIMVLNTTGGSWISRSAFACGSADTRLADRTTEHSDCETDAGRECTILIHGTRIIAGGSCFLVQKRSCR